MSVSNNTTTTIDKRFTVKPISSIKQEYNPIKIVDIKQTQIDNLITYQFIYDDGSKSCEMNVEIPEPKNGEPGQDGQRGQDGERGQKGESGKDAPKISSIEAYARQWIFRFDDGTDVKVPIKFPDNKLDEPGLSFGGQRPPVQDIRAGENITVVNNNGIFTISSTGGGGGIPDAPSDGKIYGRQDGEWVEITATSNGVTYYTRKDQTQRGTTIELPNTVEYSDDTTSPTFTIDIEKKGLYKVDFSWISNISGNLNRDANYIPKIDGVSQLPATVPTLNVEFKDNTNRRPFSYMVEEIFFEAGSHTFSLAYATESGGGTRTTTIYELRLFVLLLEEVLENNWQDDGSGYLDNPWDDNQIWED